MSGARFGDDRCAAGAHAASSLLTCARSSSSVWSAPAEERLSASVTEVSRTERREEAEPQNHLHQVNYVLFSPAHAD